MQGSSQTLTPKWLLLSSVVGIAILAAVWIAGNHLWYLWNFAGPGSVPMVRYIIPSGFRGAIAMSVEEDGRQPTPLGDGIYQVDVPESGKVALFSDEVFLRYHEVTAVWSDGRPLPLGVALSENDVETVAFWGMYTDGYGVHWEYVGNRMEMKAARAKVTLSPGEDGFDTEAADRNEAVAGPQE